MYAISLGDDGAQLRPLEPWHAEEFLAHLDRGREFIGQFIPFGSQSTDVPSTRAHLQRYADMRAADTGSLHGLWLDGKLVGGVLFLNFDAEQGNCEVGCWLEPAASGRGLVTRAMRVLIDWAVEGRGIHRIEWVAAAGNVPSLNVARRLGMTQDGVLREKHPYRGVRHDLEVWSVLAPDWRAARAHEAHKDH
ncbi:GNAT family N-acetyltransferase [Streptomyces sp. NPDC060011]|jgi:ribosomal-protein-serine acetyltransferase|uniref:GNAT family N-acetyltransferase n=1 Tax=unclassified Streptomyces TaxID=2593676 RepID=UPI0013B6C9F8|nr:MULTISPECIES: GNAT family protein [unclassified Streptomyces]MCX4917214.1 GNAT family N-acetyltransferase [Streptomyces sp. NBC_00687]MCX5130684.1 GNAT family N-acetyltransferase [Streptomyces sp. NBC_00340]MCX5279292.1 GNAT family N-acetyltransferase [Streptomyces sp. NBC_00198]NEB27569.1 GNAT family N-acetyltransferase [Streptomyces sp. SID14446]